MKNENINQQNVTKTEHLVQNKKRLRRIDFDIVKRVMSLLHRGSRIKKTNLAMKCNLGYDKCILYLDWLEKMDLIKRETDEDHFEIITLTERGYEFSGGKMNDL